MINYRLSKLSCDMQVFHDRVKPYNEALKRSGFYKLRGYMDSESIRKNKKKRGRPRNITFFNPPFCDLLKTKVGKQFFNLVNLHFSKNSEVSTIFSKSTIKLS